MITGIDHLVVGAPNLAAAVEGYGTLLALEPAASFTADGRESALFQLANVALCLQESDSSEGLIGLCLAVDDLSRFRRRSERVGLPIIREGAHPLASSGTSESGSVLYLDSESTRGLALSVTERGVHGPGRPANSGASITGLDHVVVATGDGDACALLFGARLGLDMRLDRSNPDWGSRLLFFRCGDAVLEVMQPLGEGDHSLEGSDRFYGLSWRVADADASWRRLSGADVEVSEVRQGRKPGTRVLTVRSGTAGVPTLLLQPPASRAES